MEQKQQNQESKSSGIAKALKQQVLKAWQPVPTINSTIALFGILSVYFLSMGIVLNVYTSEIKQQTFRYDAYCQGYAVCEFPLALDDFYQSPVYFYYQIDNFYQNGRRYVTSKNADQLSGQSNLGVSDLSSCTPVITNGQMNKTLAIDNVTALDPTAPAIPCGLIAQSVFNDTFFLTSDGNDTIIPISSTNIAWPTDINLYKNIDLSQQWLNMEDERFMVWMRVAAMPNFRKLWGIIYQSLPAGRYLVQIQNNYNSSYFAGKKSIVFSTTNEFGGKNQFLSVAYLFVGVASSLVTIGLLLKKYFSRGQKKTL